jgi:hypothetical protein
MRRCVQCVCPGLTACGFRVDATVCAVCPPAWYSPQVRTVFSRAFVRKVVKHVSRVRASAVSLPPTFAERTAVASMGVGLRKRSIGNGMSSMSLYDDMESFANPRARTNSGRYATLSVRALSRRCGAHHVAVRVCGFVSWRSIHAVDVCGPCGCCSLCTRACLLSVQPAAARWLGVPAVYRARLQCAAGHQGLCRRRWRWRRGR